MSSQETAQAIAGALWGWGLGSALLMASLMLYDRWQARRRSKH